jgi:hypothetical protein
MSSKSRDAPGGIRLRAFALGIVVIPLNAYWITQFELNRWSFPTYLVPYYNAIFCLAVLSVANVVVGRALPRVRLRRSELLLVYLMASVVSSLCSHNMMEILVTTMPHAHRYASPENDWATLILPYLPNRLVVSDAKALEGYYTGGGSLWRWETLRVWLPPTFAWFAFTMALLGVMLALTTLLRRQWTERERLSYPIIQLPLALVGESPHLWRERSLWVGFALTGTATLWNGVAALVPVLPAIPLKRLYDLQTFFRERPWNAIGWTPVTVHPHLIGLGFLMPLDLLFSSWFFYWFLKWEFIARSAFALRALPRFPYEKEQSLGAYIAVAVVALWMGRAHLRRYIGSAWRGTRDAASDPVVPRVAVLGAALGFAFLVGFSQWAGMGFVVAAGFFVIYYLLSVAMTRMRAEFGFPIHDAHYPLGPDHATLIAYGTRRLGASNLSVLALYHWFNRTYASHPMPNELEAFKMSERLGGGGRLNRQLFGAFLLATAVSVFVTFAIILDAFYRQGSASGRFTWWGSGGFGRETYWWLEGWLTNPTGSDVVGVGFVGVGFSVAFALHYLRTRFLWWQFHPLGYAVASSWGIHVWSSFLVAWVAKWLVLKYAGIRGYRRGVPFVLGLILGEYLVGSVWNWVAILGNVTTYQFSVG